MDSVKDVVLFCFTPLQLFDTILFLLLKITIIERPLNCNVWRKWNDFSNLSADQKICSMRGKTLDPQWSIAQPLKIDLSIFSV